MALRVGVFGAGAIGGYLGVRLSAAGAAVTLVGRRSLLEVDDRLHAITLDGAEVRPNSQLQATDNPAALATADVVLVTVKSQATPEAGTILAEHLAEDTTVVSFQNGLGNAQTLTESLGPRVVAGMVTFNVFREDGGARFRQATSGPLVAGLGLGHHAGRMRSLAELFEAGQLPLRLHDDIDNVLAGKLVINLINGICASTGLPFAQALRSRDARWCLAQCMLEGLRTLRHAEVHPATIVGLPPWIIARALLLPNAILLRIAKRMISIDPSARSSTLQDLDAGKVTEIEQLNGTIVSLGQEHDVPTPANAIVTETVHGLEGQALPLDFLTPAELRERIDARRRGG